MCQRSRLGSPSTIHSASCQPMPPAPASPWAQNPAATQNPGTSDSPRMNSPSGVNASGPLKSFLTSAVSIAGTRTIEFSSSSSNRGQSSGSSCASNPSGTPSSAHGAGSRSYPPMISPPTSVR